MRLKNMFLSSPLASRDYSLKLFSAVWSIVILAPLILPDGARAFAGLNSAPPFIGHPWKAELVASLLLGVFLVYRSTARRKNISPIFAPPAIAAPVIAPFAAFILWSALSAFWAASGLSVLHHTLVWACYLIFFLFALNVASDKRLLKVCIISIGSTSAIICIASIIEFLSKDIIEFRYAKFAEIFAALLPVFFSFTLRTNRKYLIASILVTVSLWLAILFSLSRGALLASVSGLAVFIFLRLFAGMQSAEKRRLTAAVAGVVFIALLTQIPQFIKANDQKESTFSRMVIKDEKEPSNSLSLNARFLFAGVAEEMLFDEYLTGVGADNFGLEFNKYRAVFSAKPENESTASLYEEFLPQRAHNEYLQILAELGIVGALIFLWLFRGIVKLGFAEVKRNRFRRTRILTDAAIGGIVAFLVSSLFSSFSFRLAQNGLVFFFLLAILLRNFAAEKNREKQNDLLAASNLKRVFASIALAACLVLAVSSALKAGSENFLYRAVGEKEFGSARYNYENAARLDPANSLASYSFAVRCLEESDYREAAAQLEQAVKKGFNASVNYSHLISSQLLANQWDKALETASESVEIFPYSGFLRIRYALLLKKFHRDAEADRQLEFAARIDKKQADTWRLVINNGPLTASREARVNKEILSLDELKPNSAIYTVLTEQQVADTNKEIEKAKFNFRPD